MSENIEDMPGRPHEGEDDRSETESFFDPAELAALGDASDVLALGPMRGSLDDVACSALMDTWRVADRNVLFVSFTQSADERFALMRDTVDGTPGNVYVVSGADRYASETSVDTPGGRTTLAVETVRDPSDLPRLGMTISRAVDEWDDGGDPLVCFHSLTAMLQYAEPKRVFRFVHLLQNRLHATAHYHMDSEAHDRQTVATLQPLFDLILEYDAQGNVTLTD